MMSFCKPKRIFYGVRIGLITMGLFINLVTLAQNEHDEADTIKPKQWKFETSRQLADTAWWALQQKTKSELISLLPTIDVITTTLDSLLIKTNPQVIKIKYNTILAKINKQVKVLNAKAKVNKIKLKTCEKGNVKIEEGQDDKGNVFAYITIGSHKNKRDFVIKFVALYLNHSWYLVDELELEFPEDDPYYKIPEKSPMKIKRK